MLKKNNLEEYIINSLKGYISNVSYLQAILNGIDQSSINEVFANEYIFRITDDKQQVKQEFKTYLYKSLINWISHFTKLSSMEVIDRKTMEQKEDTSILHPKRKKKT